MRWAPRQRYLLDHSLSGHVATALAAAGWPIQTVPQLFGVTDRDRIPDEALIPRCAAEGLAWITADERARRQHWLALTTHHVSVLWVHRPKEGMSTAYQLAVLGNAIGHFDHLLTSHVAWALYCEVPWAVRNAVKEIHRERRPPPA